MKIVNRPGGDPNRVTVELDVVDFIQRPYYLPGADRPHASGDQIQDAIRRAGWQILMRKAPKLKYEEFAHGEVEAVNGGVVVTFYRINPDVPNEPGPKEA
jgi:hypothetical protein